MVAIIQFADQTEVQRTKDWILLSSATKEQRQIWNWKDTIGYEKDVQQTSHCRGKDHETKGVQLYALTALINYAKREFGRNDDLAREAAQVIYKRKYILTTGTDGQLGICNNLLEQFADSAIFVLDEEGLSKFPPLTKGQKEKITNQVKSAEEGEIIIGNTIEAVETYISLQNKKSYELAMLLHTTC